MEDDLVASGRFVRVTTRGGRTGLARSVTIGFVEDDDGPPGSILVSAGATGGRLGTQPAGRSGLSGRDRRSGPGTPSPSR